MVQYDIPIADGYLVRVFCAGCIGDYFNQLWFGISEGPSHGSTAFLCAHLSK